MPVLSDPRTFGVERRDDPLVRLAAAVAAGGSERPQAERRLRAAVRERLEQEAEAEIHAALAAVSNAACYRALWDALVAVVEAPGPDGGDITAQAFALPLVLVAASTQRVVLPAVLDGIEELVALFERQHALGQTRNFGLSNALAELAAFERLPALQAYEAARSLDTRQIRGAFPPAPVVVETGREQAHLRFLVGAGIAPSHAPDFTETAANIGAWGGACSRWLGARLTTPGSQLLVLPRPPCALLRAGHVGRTAQLDVALHLFVSAAVRRFRQTVGDPVAILSVHDDWELRVSLSSPFADDLIEGYRWPLHPLDDLDQIARQIAALLEQVRIGDVRTVRGILPALRAGGAIFHPCMSEWPDLAARTLQ